MADLDRAPATRWRVVERDRRLVVVDARTGVPAGDPPPAIELAAHLPYKLRRTRFDGRAELTTHPLYDRKGPRTVRLDPGSAATIGRLKLAAIGLMFGAVLLLMLAPGLLLLPVFALSATSVRTRLRDAVTHWLDRVERAAG